MRLNAVLAFWLLPAAKLRARQSVGVAEHEFRQAANAPMPNPLDTFDMENAPVAFVKFGSHSAAEPMRVSFDKFGSESAHNDVKVALDQMASKSEEEAVQVARARLTLAAPTSRKVNAPAKTQATASIHGRVVGPNKDTDKTSFDPPESFVQLSRKVKKKKHHKKRKEEDEEEESEESEEGEASSSESSSSSNETSDVGTSAPPADLAALLAKLDNISAEVQETELATVALQTKVNTAESQISQNAVSLEEAYQALHAMEGQKTNNSFNINLMEESSGEIHNELEVQGTELANLTGEVGNLEVNVASISPAAQDLGTKAHEVSDKVTEHIPALDNVTSRLDTIESSITALEERMGTEGVAGPVKEDMDALVNDVNMQVHDLDDTVSKQGIPRRLIIKDPAKLLLNSPELAF
jgi:predicted  nucleic acid-binding Zn-ribbon protein